MKSYNHIGEKDWYVSRVKDGKSKYERVQILSILLMAQLMIETDIKIGKSDYSLRLLSLRCGKMEDILRRIEWDEMKEVVKAMKRKYDKEKNHVNYEDFINVARKLKSDINDVALTY